jgi:O-antigen/teichoic acid export membrane protein
VSTQVAVASRAAALLGRRRAGLSGAWLLSGAMVLSGVLTYAFHVLAARALGPDSYGRIAVLWGAMFLAAVVLFRPVEQTSSRAIADRLARGDEVATVIRSVLVLCAGVLVVAVVGGLAAWPVLSDGLFGGDDMLTAMLIVGTAVYGLAYLVRGFLGGVRWFSGYGLGLIADAVARIVVAAPLVFIASQNVAAAAIVAAGLAGIVVPLAAGHTLLRRQLVGEGGERFHPRAALAFAAPASIIAGADQLLVNGSPILVIAGGGAAASKEAGVVFAATMLVRVPVYVFQGLAASLLPNLTRLQATREADRFRRSVLRAVGILLGVSAVIAAGAALIGPQAMSILYGSGFDAGRVELTLLAASVGGYLAAATLSQALLAMDAGGRAAAAWALASVLFVGLYVILPGEALLRISIALAVALAVGSVILTAGLLRLLRRA